MFGLATVYVADVKLIGVQIVNVHVIPQGYLDQSDSNGTSASFFFTGHTVFLGKDRFTKIQNGKKQDKLLLPLTKTRALLRLHRLTKLQHRSL